MDPDVDRRYQGSAEAEKYGNIQEFCASEDAPMTKENLEFGGKYRGGSQRRDRRAERPGGRQKTGDIGRVSLAALPRVRPLCTTAQVEEEREVM
mmetsp:Transcript_102412/g.328325  ORF Transcript_102412/g.328325 Transcript_102412/m.328325 type:complete len:94 (+) Transcript_102412:66-347(+)